MKQFKVSFLLSIFVCIALMISCNSNDKALSINDGFLIGSNELAIANAENKQPKGIWDYPGKSGLWDYPVKPGTAAWKQFQSNEEMVNACQIPEEVIASLTTEDLTDLCIRYPLLIDFFAFNHTNAGINKLFSDFNGILALYKRKDVSSNLVRRYAQLIQSISFLNGQNTNIEKGFFIITISTLEVLISQIEWQEIQGKESPIEALQVLVAGYEAKMNYKDYFRGLGFHSNFFSRANVISKMDRSFIGSLSNKEHNSAFSSGMISDEQTIDVINNFSYQLLNK